MTKARKTPAEIRQAKIEKLARPIGQDKPAGTFLQHGIRHNKNTVLKVFQELRRAESALEAKVYRAGEWHVMCVTSLQWLPWRGSNLMDAGHFLSRDHTAICFDRTNCHPQSKADNKKQAGGCLVTAARYREYMVDRYGQDHVDWLHEQTAKVIQYTKYDLAELMVDFQAELRSVIHELKELEKVQ